MTRDPEGAFLIRATATHLFWIFVLILAALRSIAFGVPDYVAVPAGLAALVLGMRRLGRLAG